MDEDDRTLIRKFVAHGSEEAFTELVERYLALVYSTALRRLGDAHAAEEITQAVFTLLAQKVRSLHSNVILAGWLYQTANFKAAQHQRAEHRRRIREQEAVTMQHTDSPSDDETDAAWQEIEPLLDEAMQDLSETDRSAILLRFFQRKRLREVGLALGVDEESARKRVSRAVSKLRDWFGARGIVCPGTAVTAALSAHAAQSTPAVLASVVSGTALKAAAAGVGTLGIVNLIQIVAAMKIKTGLLTAGFLLVIALVTMNHFQRTSDSRTLGDSDPSLVEGSMQPNEQPSNSPFWRRVQAAHQARLLESAADGSLANVLARLSEALYAPATERREEDPARDILYSIPLEQRVAALDMVMKALRDPNRHVSLRAVRLVPLIWPQGEAALPLLFDLIRTKADEWPGLTSEALMAAVQVRSNTDIIPELVAAVIQGPARAQAEFASQLPLLKSQIADSDAFFSANLRPFLHSHDAHERLTAAQSLAQLSGPIDPAVVSELIASITVGNDAPVDASQIRASLNALLRIGTDARDALPALQALAEGNVEMRDAINLVIKAVAADELKGVGVPTPLPPIDPAADAIARRIEEGTMTVGGLTSALEDPATSLIAARALAEFGPAAGEALPALERAFNAALETNLPAAMVLGATIERLNPDAPKPLLNMMDLMPALEAVHATVQQANQPVWNDALETLPQRAPLGMAFQHEDMRRLANELGRIDPSLRNAFIEKLLEVDLKFASIFQTPE